MRPCSRLAQVNGHFAAKLDPLGLYQRELPTVMDPKLYGFTEADMDRECVFAAVHVNHSQIRIACGAKLLLRVIRTPAPSQAQLQ
jgi:2-oxoglutarate dehydrogenase complex dehydrogenase (E1) component-like enzyme